MPSMSTIKVKMMSEDALIYLKNNIKRIADKILENDDNHWINTEFPSPIFIEKKFDIDDFELKDNPESADKDLDLENSIVLYEKLNCQDIFFLMRDFGYGYILISSI